MHIRSVNVHVESQFLTNSLDVLKTFLVVRTSTTNPDLDLVFVEGGSHFPESANDTLECGSDVGEVGNTTTNEKNLSFGALRSSEHQIQNCAGVVEGLSLSGSTRVFTVVGQLANESSRCNSVGVDDRGTTTSDQSPDTATGIENGQLQGSTGLGVHVRNELLLLAEFTTERSGEFHWGTSINVNLAITLGSRQTKGSRAASNSPLGTTFKLSSLVELGSQVEEVNLGGGGISVGDNDEGVDLEVGELAVDVDSVQAGDEVNQDIVNASRHLLQQSSGNLFVGGEVFEVNGDQELLSLGIDITDVDTTFVSEENPVALEIISP